MFVIEVIGERNHALIPRVPLASLVPADEQDGQAPRIKCKQHPQVATARAQLLHIGVPRATDGIHERAPESRPSASRCSTAKSSYATWSREERPEWCTCSTATHGYAPAGRDDTKEWTAWYDRMIRCGPAFRRRFGNVRKRGAAA